MPYSVSFQPWQSLRISNRFCAPQRVLLAQDKFVYVHCQRLAQHCTAQLAAVVRLSLRHETLEGGPPRFGVDSTIFANFNLDALYINALHSYHIHTSR